MKRYTSPLRRICRSRLGFTLVELVLVIALLAIVAAVAVPSFANLRKKSTDTVRKNYLKQVVKQGQTIVTTYNSAMNGNTTPRFAGYNLSTAKAMQECLRAANNHGDEYDVVVTTVAPSAEDALYYNYIDTIVVCIQFYGKTTSGEEILITRKVGTEDIPCSPELGDKNIQPRLCKFVVAKYFRIDNGTTVMEDWTY